MTMEFYSAGSPAPSFGFSSFDLADLFSAFNEPVPAYRLDNSVSNDWMMPYFIGGSDGPSDSGSFASPAASGPDVSLNQAPLTISETAASTSCTDTDKRSTTVAEAIQVPAVQTVDVQSSLPTVTVCPPSGYTSYSSLLSNTVNVQVGDEVVAACIAELGFSIDEYDALHEDEQMAIINMLRTTIVWKEQVSDVISAGLALPKNRNTDFSTWTDEEFDDIFAFPT
ncbi:hypothetical protein BJ508DRAFT_333187 [Ascobolus immersus RN42]|uniref:Uncharacterized protein n=1 Tax=Ascobolus immersus RN42 TaxID=1160509 RepID=A0A3N4HQF9_ASCIM|nr:hypothetical protein BJ508DRAFT_333187 [Ascobolus immersus RN42]